MFIFDPIYTALVGSDVRNYSSFPPAIHYTSSIPSLSSVGCESGLPHDPRCKQETIKIAWLNAVFYRLVVVKYDRRPLEHSEIRPANKYWVRVPADGGIGEMDELNAFA